MLDQGLVKTHFLGKDGFIWWIGQIVDQTQWGGNFPEHPTPTTKEQKGFDFRYKVRIMGYHTASQADLPNEDLPWASVLLPVTAGVSGGGMSTPNLRRGNFVQGFFMDGEDAQQPVIMGVLGYNQYTDILKNPPEDVSFVPFSGYTVKDQVPQYSLPLVENQTTEAKSEGVKEGDSNYSTVLESTIRSQTTDDGASEEQKNAETKSQSLVKEVKCEPVPIGPIQTKIKNMLTDVENLKKSATKWETKVSNKIYDVQEEIDKTINNATRNISTDIKTTIQGIQENALKEVNNALSETYNNVFPTELPLLKEKVETANDELSCAFKNIMKNLTGMVGGFLKDMIDKVVNVAECLINNFIGSLFGKITGLIDSAVSAAMAPIKSLLSGMGSATSAIDDVLGFATNALSFLSCDEDPNCSNVKDWNPTDGAQINATLDLQSIFGKAKAAADSVKDAVSGFANLGDAISDISKGVDFSDVFENNCNVGPLFCGPPTIQFFGGGGSGATGNAIISAAGTLLGVDIITPGGGYIGAPTIRFNDTCNKGIGASGKAVVEDGKVVRVVMDDTGTGYLTAPDGSQGGDGRTWADADETTVRRFNNTYDPPYRPGSVITVCPGDEVTYPGGSSVIITGDECQDITAPPLDDTIKGGPFPSTGTGDYPVVLELEGINVTDSGLNYDSSKDKVVMEPSHGCEFKLRLDALGSVLGVDVVRGCVGFNEDPDIYIQSDTGYNAKLMPVFKVNRVGEDVVPELVSSGELIQVIDCVGKV